MGAASGAASVVEVHAVSTRGRETPDTNRFTNARSAERNFARFSISIPPNHLPGRIEWPRDRIDPASTFAVVDQRIGTRATFLERVGRTRDDGTDVVLFVHGFNQSFVQALYRLAQLAVDAEMNEVPVLFAWPSEGSAVGYVADRDSAAFSRDALAATLSDFAGNPRIRSVTIVAHSLGGWLTMEALRQLRLKGEAATLDRLDVVLASPDIDADLFERQLAVLGPLRRPITVLVASDDRALRASMRIGGSHERVGLLDVTDPEVERLARRKNIAIVDLTGVEAADPLNHSRYSALAGLASAMDSSGASGHGVRQAGAFVFKAVGTTLSAPFELVGRALAGE